MIIRDNDCELKTPTREDCHYIEYGYGRELIDRKKLDKLIELVYINIARSIQEERTLQESLTWTRKLAHLLMLKNDLE